MLMFHNYVNAASEILWVEYNSHKGCEYIKCLGVTKGSIEETT